MAEDRGVEFEFVQTDRPWELDIDAIVLSVGSDLGGLGNLGRAVKSEFPGADWDSVNYDSISNDRPALLRLHDANGTARMITAILVTARGTDGEMPSYDSVEDATYSALEAAESAGLSVVGLPLLATGAFGADKGMVANAMMSAVTGATDSFTQLGRIVFFGRGAEDATAVRAEFAKYNIAWSVAGLRLGSTDLAGGLSRDLVDPNQTLSLDEDRLGFAPYVSMLATVIADRDTPLPLSIGVFGEWGAGKSSFMGMLRTEVKRLAAGDDRYHREIAQIGFNAWHYADSNLWASLGDEIFRQLAGPETTSQERADKLRAKLTSRLEQGKQLKAATEQAGETAAKLRAQVDQALAKQEVTAKALVGAIRKSAWKRLGVTDEAERGKLLAEELRGTLTEADLLRRAPRDRRGKIALAVAAILLLGGVFAAAVAPELRDWLKYVGGVFVVVAGWGTWALARARSGLRKLRELGEDLHAGLVKEAVGKDLEKLRAAEAEQLVAEAQLKEVVQHVGELGRELAQLAPGSRLYSFLAARSDAYSGNLGLISVIRKDFQQLVELMVDWRTNPKQGDAPRKPVERIVLYIDDLDRCSPSQVVDVLQAVHLLLAFELFVVVVGVDPRWLLRSVQSHYADILDDHATPEDYLEKIVNIPFALPGMVDDSMSRLLRGMIGPNTAEIPQRVPTRTVPPPTAEEPGLITVEEGSEVDTQRRSGGTVQPPRPMTEAELTLLATLGPLIGTPREAKRILNLYRMIRATRNLSDASSFLGGEYEMVIILLGLLTAPADLTGRVLDALLTRPADTAWPAFLADLLPSRENEVWHNGLVGEIPGGEVGRWQRLHHGLAKVSEQATLTDLAGLQTWIPRMRCFTYGLPAGA